MLIYDSDKLSRLKQQAALQAVEAVQDSMVVGLGTGSTAAYAVEALGNKVTQGLRIVAVPTSEKTAKQAMAAGIKLINLEQCANIDLTIDGADQVERDSLNLIKGLGGALLREKIVAIASKRVIIVVDDSKVTPKLGGELPVPVEVVQFGWSTTEARLRSLGASTSLRKTRAGEPFITDSGNLIIDCRFEDINDARFLESAMSQVVGVVENGLFINIATEVIVASVEGISRLTRVAR